MDYLELITSQHATRPKFAATIAALTQPLTDLIITARSLPGAFDLDQAIGAQLDAVGLWVGLSRHFTVPISGAFFSWDIEGLGWDEGSWKGPFVSTAGIQSLDDGAYRLALKAKIAANYWDGTNEEHLDILRHGLEGLGVVLVPVDEFDMSITLYAQGANIPLVVKEMLRRGYVIPKPTGVRVRLLIDGELPETPPLFSLDDPLAGLDIGGFA